MTKTRATLAGYRVIAQADDLLRLRRDDGREAVVRYSESANQVYSVGPDNPQPGCCWCARATAKGVNYVANWISTSAARSRFRAEIARL